MECLHGEFDVEPGNGGDRCDYLKERGIETYLVVVPKGTVGKSGINGVVCKTFQMHSEYYLVLCVGICEYFTFFLVCSRNSLLPLPMETPRC